jgi:hypothetical protein
MNGTHFSVNEFNMLMNGKHFSVNEFSMLMNGGAGLAQAV